MYKGMVPLKTGPVHSFDDVKDVRKVSQLVRRAIHVGTHDFEYVHATCSGETGMLQDWVGKLVSVIRDSQAFVVMVGQSHVTHYRFCEVVCFHKLEEREPLLGKPAKRR